MQERSGCIAICVRTPNLTKYAAGGEPSGHAQPSGKSTLPLEHRSEWSACARTQDSGPGIWGAILPQSARRLRLERVFPSRGNRGPIVFYALGLMTLLGR